MVGFTLFVARLKYWAWQFLTKGLLGIIYVAVISEGLRYLVPALGQKLYKLPGLDSLRYYEETYRLDLAPVLSIFILIAVWYLWGEILELWLRAPKAEDFVWRLENRGQLVVALGFVILGADACLFYVAMTQVGWGATFFSLAALVATAAYVAVLVFVSFVSLNLRHTTINLRKEQGHDTVSDDSADRHDAVRLRKTS